MKGYVVTHAFEIISTCAFVLVMGNVGGRGTATATGRKRRRQNKWWTPHTYMYIWCIFIIERSPFSFCEVKLSIGIVCHFRRINPPPAGGRGGMARASERNLWKKSKKNKPKTPISNRSDSSSSALFFFIFLSLSMTRYI